MTTSISVNEAEVVVAVTEERVELNVCEQVTEVSVSTAGPQGPRGSQILSGATDPSPIIGLRGDQYINTTTGYLFGPKTESGWGSGVRLGEQLGINDISHVFYQTFTSDIWNITHPLQFKPSITVVDLSGNVIEGDYQYTGDTIIATFSQAIAGAAYLS